MFKNYGLINEELFGDEEVFGGSQTLEILQQDRNWIPFLPIKELQNLFHETWGCTVFALLNCFEIWGKRVYGVELNKSDRFSNKMAGTVPNWGNTMRGSFETFPRDGWVDEAIYPFNSKSVQEYYQTIPQHIIDLAKSEGEKVEFSRQIISGVLTPEKLWDALQYSPLRVTVLAWEEPVNGVYRRSSIDFWNHLVTLVKGEYKKSWWIFDHYDQDIKELSWDFRFGSVDIPTFKFKNMNNPFVRIVKDENSNAVGFFVPATSPDALTSMSLAYNKEIVKLENGDIDWSKTIEGSVKLEQPL